MYYHSPSAPPSSSSSAYPFMSIPTGIQGQLLEVTVVGCSKLKDTEWFSRQDPYVCVEYASTKFRTRTCTDGGKNPTFQEKFTFTLIEGLRELNIVVWNSNTLTYDDLIGSGKVQLQKVLSQGYDDSPWTIQTKTGRYSGEVRLILHYANASASASANKPPKTYAPSAPPYAAPSQAAPYSYPPPATASPYPPPASVAHYPQPSSGAHYPPPASTYPPPSSYHSYPHDSSAYPPPPYPPTHSAAYPPQPYPPRSAYPPPSPSHNYPPGPYPGTYPPPY